jgi:hypothetical protein
VKAGASSFIVIQLNNATAGGTVNLLDVSQITVGLTKNCPFTHSL